MENLLSIIGSIASVGAAIWAYIEAKKSSAAATRAQTLHDELIHRREMVEVSQVHSETKRILAVVSKVGPSCNPKLLKGVNCSEIAQEVQSFSVFILEQSEHFSDFFENKAKELNEDLKVDIEGLSEASTFEEKKSYGKSMFYKIQNFMPAVKNLSDEKRDRVIK